MDRFRTNGDIGRCVDNLLMNRGVDTIAVEPAAAYEEVVPQRQYRVRPNYAPRHGPPAGRFVSG